MSRKSRFSREYDPLGEKVEIANPQLRHERLFFLYAPSPSESANLPLIIQHCGNSIWDAGVAITRNKSNFFGLELVIAGNIQFTQDGRSYLVGPGQIFVLRKGCNHSYATGPAGFAHKRIICIDGPMLGLMLSQLKLLEGDVFTVSNAHWFSEYVKSAARIFQARAPGFTANLSAIAYSLLVSLGGERKKSPYTPIVQSGLDYMHQHINRFVTLKELSGITSVSVPHFCRLFQQQVGSAPMAYFRSLRVRYARQLLIDTSTRINEVARAMGYEDIAHFSTFFSRETGESPREFRNKRTGNVYQ
jgi:AraC-like DNA-binding protein